MKLNLQGQRYIKICGFAHRPAKLKFNRQSLETARISNTGPTPPRFPPKVRKYVSLSTAREGLVIGHPKTPRPPPRWVEKGGGEMTTSPSPRPAQPPPSAVSLGTTFHLPGTADLYFGYMICFGGCG